MTRGSNGLPKPGECPGAELIAAHAERRLVGEAAAQMDEHLASCPTCHEAFAETLRCALDEQEVEPLPERVRPHPGTLRAFVRRPAFRVAASLAAAALLGLVFLHSLQSLWPSKVPARPLVAGLADALATSRFVEPRLTGGFRHGRLVVLRSGGAAQGLDAYPPAVLSAIAEIRERAENDPSPRALGALGVTYLVSGDVGAAVRALESATKQAPDDAHLLNDLSAAYLVRASRLDEPADLPRALDAAEKSIELAGAPEEAWFNRALALESLHLVDAARKAWQDYLERDPASGWADEARQHLEKLDASKQSSREDDRARVRTALREGSRSVESLARDAPSIVREYFEAELLPAWAEAHLSGRPDALVLRERARAIGELLLRITGDALPRDTALSLDAVPSTASRDPPRSQALGYLAYQEARRRYDVSRPACPLFREALRLLEEGGSPYVDRARESVVNDCILRAQPPAALAQLRRLESASRERAHLHVLARVHWLEGLLLGRRGDVTASLARYHLARAAFRRLGDTESEAAMSALIAESLHDSGETRQAWRERRAGLALLDRVRSPRGLHRTLTEASLACQSGGFMRSALHFQTAILGAARAWGSTLTISDALLTRALILHSRGADGLAGPELAEARQLIARIGDPSSREFMEALADEANGVMLADRNPEAAVAAFRRALPYFERVVPSRLPALRLLLARALVHDGRDSEAEAELRAGIERLELERASLADVALQASFFDLGLPLFDEMVRLQVDRHHDPGRGLLFVERGRARQLADSLGEPPASRADGESPSTRDVVMPLEPEALQSVLPSGVALVYYVSLRDRLLSWVLTRDGIGFVERPLPADELNHLVAAYQAGIDVRAPAATLRGQSARLYDELVRPIGGLLGRRRALILVRDDVLQPLPFASLWNRQTGRYLVEDYALELAPSGTVFARASVAAADPRRALGPPALVVGNPRLDRKVWAGLPSLPGAEAEAADIVGLYERAELLTGTEATKEAFLAGLSTSRIVHFAGHAVSDHAPWTARLLLSPDPDRDDSGALSLRDLDGRDLPNARLVVLAACRTGAATVSALEGSLNLARPFLAAGVPTVVASLWDLDDAMSRTFLVDFHRRLRAQGDPVLALREAQVAQLHQPDPVRAHPATWAGFVAVGGIDSRVIARLPPRVDEPLARRAAPGATVRPRPLRPGRRAPPPGRLGRHRPPARISAVLSQTPVAGRAAV